MPKQPNEHCFHLNGNYTSLIIWTFEPETRQRVVQAKIRPTKGHSKLERYEILSSHLKEKGITPPEYKGKKKK